MRHYHNRAIHSITVLRLFLFPVLMCLILLVPNKEKPVYGDDPPANPATSDPTTQNIGNNQEFIARKWKEFAKNLLLVAQRLEKSDRLEDQEKAKSLRKAIELAEKEGVDNKFTVLVRTLKKDRLPEFNDIQSAGQQNQELLHALDQIINILLNDDDLARIREERERLQKFLNELKGIIVDSKTVRSITEKGKSDKDQLTKDQKDLANRTDKLGKAMEGKPDSKDGKNGKDSKSDGKDSKGDSKDGKDSKGGKDGKDGKSGKGDSKGGKDGKDGKSGKGDSKGGKDSKGGGQPKDGQSGNSDQGKSGQSPPPTPGTDQVKKAVPDENDAANNIDKKKNDDAVKNQDDAIQKLIEARQELEKRLKQLRDEELERLLSNLEARLSRMLAMQKDVYENTKALDAIAKKSMDKKLPKAEYQRTQQQSDKEGDIIVEADRTIDLLKNEGSVVAFPQVLEETRKDMQRVKERLYSAIVDSDTQFIEADIIASLEEMLKAVKKAQQDLKSNPGSGGSPSSGNQNQKLIDELAELKLIKSLQERVNFRTKKWATKYKGEQTSDPNIKNEFRDLSDKQIHIEQMVKDIVTGKNK